MAHFFKKTSKRAYFFVTADYCFTLYNDVPEFSNYKFPSRASTYKVISGGWALYSEPDFQGKVMYQFGSESAFLIIIMNTFVSISGQKGKNVFNELISVSSGIISPPR